MVRHLRQLHRLRSWPGLLPGRQGSGAGAVHHSPGSVSSRQRHGLFQWSFQGPQEACRACLSPGVIEGRQGFPGVSSGHSTPFSLSALPEPLTPTPTPQPPNLPPYTLHPTPYTLNPRPLFARDPVTPNPEPLHPHPPPPFPTPSPDTMVPQTSTLQQVPSGVGGGPPLPDAAPAGDHLAPPASEVLSCALTTTPFPHSAFPEHCTPTPTPQPPNLPCYTLHPTPYTLNPRPLFARDPVTPNPEPLHPHPPPPFPTPSPDTLVPETSTLQQDPTRVGGGPPRPVAATAGVDLAPQASEVLSCALTTTPFPHSALSPAHQPPHATPPTLYPTPCTLRPEPYSPITASHALNTKHQPLHSTPTHP